MTNDLSQKLTAASGGSHLNFETGELSREAAAEGCVLLINDGTLPLKKDDVISAFGRCQLDWFYAGYGSGGDVNAPYYVNLIDGISNAGGRINAEVLSAYREWTLRPENKTEKCEWGQWKESYPEMPLDKELVRRSSAESSVAMVVIGRCCGEDKDFSLKNGSYYLNNEELDMLDKVTAVFDKTIVVLNFSSLIDMSWVEKYKGKISALLLAFCGGMESGNAVADVLYGDVNPSGRLSDTIPRNFEDYPFNNKPVCAAGVFEDNNKDCYKAEKSNLPLNRTYEDDLNIKYHEGIFVGYRYFEKFAADKILFSFGFGLSYTKFKTEKVSFAYNAGTEEKDGVVKMSVSVINSGSCAGKKAVGIFCRQGGKRLLKPERVLAAFSKTKLLAPGEREMLDFSVPLEMIASFDEKICSFVIEKGKYVFEADETYLGEIEFSQDIVVKKCIHACMPDVDLKNRILENLPKDEAISGGEVKSFGEVINNPSLLHNFVAGLSDNELEAITRGQGMMDSCYGESGNAGAFGGITDSLRKKGIPAVITSDGPSGLRLNRYASLIPEGNLLACTWNILLTEKLYSRIATEMKHYKIDVLLGPGLNIHRNPLCGRNFEYYSEDPLLSGLMAAAAVRGIQSLGASACPKHMICNNLEKNRNLYNANVGERALREIYLKNFEICIREGKPKVLMSSYNKVNGLYSHYNYDLFTTILRKEWGYDGLVITDWWMKSAYSPEFPLMRDNAYRVRAQVDVLMPGGTSYDTDFEGSDGTLLEGIDEEGHITRAEIRRSAYNVLKFIMGSFKENRLT